MVIKSTAFLQPVKLTASTHTLSLTHTSLRSYLKSCRSIRGTVTVKLQGNLKSEHLLLMWFTVGAEAEHSGVKRIKALYGRRVQWKDRHHF